jgi:hypothetical protein
LMSLICFPARKFHCCPGKILLAVFEALQQKTL